MTNGHPLDGARKRVERANKHLNEIASQIETYATSEANRIVVEHNDIRNEPNFILAPHGPLPDDIPLLIGECVYNFRAALDYLVFELSREDSGDPNPLRTQFPVYTNRDDFTDLRKARAKG